MPLNPFQLEQISDEYYAKGFVLGRNALYIHMKKNLSFAQSKSNR